MAVAVRRTTTPRPGPGPGAGTRPPALTGRDREIDAYDVLRTANLAAKFTVEIATLVAFGYWGADVGAGAVPVLLAIATPLLAAVLWGQFAAPRAKRRLPLRMRAPFELAVFAPAAVALLAASPAAGVVFAIVVIANSAVLTMLSQWDA